MKIFSKAAVTGLVLAAGMMVGAAANAATYVQTTNHSPENNNTSPAVETFNFSGLIPTSASINSFLVTMTYSKTNAATESWTGTIYGGNFFGSPVASSAFALLGTNIPDATSNSNLLTSGAAFLKAVADKSLSVKFVDTNPANPKDGPDRFKLKTISLTVDYTPVPVPASGLLLLGGLGGFAALRRRKSL